MTGLSALWLPILLSSVIVFVASTVIHMALPWWHKGDYPKVPNEDRLRDALRPLGVPPGDYMVPRPANMKEMRTPEFSEKMKKGPVMVLTVIPNGPPSMTKSLVLWFVYSAVVGLFAAYVARPARRCALPSRIPARRHHGVHRVRGSAVADVDLVPPRVGHHDQVDGRRIGLRAPHRGHLRLAVAALRLAAGGP